MNKLTFNTINVNISNEPGTKHNQYDKRIMIKKKLLLLSPEMKSK
jgi:hypothetical protein